MKYRIVPEEKDKSAIASKLKQWNAQTNVRTLFLTAEISVEQAEELKSLFPDCAIEPNGEKSIGFAKIELVRKGPATEGGFVTKGIIQPQNPPFGYRTWEEYEMREGPKIKF